MGRRFQAVFVALMTASALFVGTSAAPVEPVGTQSYIVVLQEGTGNVPEVAAEMARAHGGQVGFVYEHAIQGFSVTISPQGAAALARNPRVAYVNEDRPVWAFAESVPTGVSRIDAPTAHTKGVAGAGIRVAIIDTGIDSDHPDLTGNLKSFGQGIDCINGDTWAEDDQGHGTHVAGTVAAVDNTEGVIGVAPAAQLIPIKVLGSNGSGTTSQVICGIDHVTALNSDTIVIDGVVVADETNDIHVANMSLGGSGTHDGTKCSNIVTKARGTVTTDAEYEAICFAIASGATFVVAAGNDATNASGFVPAAYPEVITVSAYSDTNGSSKNAGCTGRGIFKTCDEVFASFSNYGDIVDVIAPGVNINSTTLGGGYGTKSGTSMASPHVAGVAALILSQNSAADVEAHLRDTGQCPDTKINGGTGDCSGQLTWSGDPDTWTEPMANADFATATGAGGGGDTNSPPTASFTYACTELACNFDGTASSDSDVGGSIVSYAWDFGDGNKGSGATATHIYGSGGSYTVTLTVTDDVGATGSESQSFTVTAPSTGISLSVSAYKVKGAQHADLTWSDATSTNVDVRRNGAVLATTANDGAYTHSSDQKGGGSATYQVCEAATSICSNEVTVSW